MKVSISECLEERARAGFTRGRDILSELYFDEAEKDVVAFVASTSLFTVQRYRKVLAERGFAVGAIIGLGSPFFDVGLRLALYVLGPKDDLASVPVLVGNFDKRPFDFTRREPRRDLADAGAHLLPERFSEAYEGYCATAEALLDSGAPPTERESDFVEVARSDFDPDRAYPSYYSVRAIELRTALGKEATVPLSSVATIIRPSCRMASSSDDRYISPATFSSDVDATRLKSGRSSDIVLQEGDLLVSSHDMRACLIRKVPPETVYVDGTSCLVLRDLKMSPEYLELYLSSDTVRMIVECTSVGGMYTHMRAEDIYQLPVVVPRLAEAEYRSLSELRRMGSRDMSALLDAGNSFEGQIASYRETFGIGGTVEEILDSELAENMRVYRREVMREFLEADLDELNTCFANGAYKATLILAGSILEAVLIDWLSEIDGTNYFTQDYMVIDRRTRRHRRADLIDYINEIREIERPNWMVEADKAHEIRKKRNLVHAKLCMRTDEVNEESCRQVIDYLRDVIETRGTL